MLLLELPQQLRLAYCLARDPRTPAPLKASLGGALAIILNPALDIPAWVPVLGQLDTISLTLVALRTFNRQAPRELRQELEAQIKAGDSQLDRDLRQGTKAALRLASRIRHLGPPGGPAAGAAATGRVAAWYRSPAALGERTGIPSPGASPGPTAPTSEESAS